MGKVYGDVNNYEGHPTEYQARRADDLARELEDVITEFKALTDKSLSAINAGLARKKLEKIVVPAEADWQKEHTGGGGGAAKVAGFRRFETTRTAE